MRKKPKKCSCLTGAISKHEVAAEALARAADNSAIRKFEEQMADAHKAMEQAMAPFSSELTRMTELANLAAPQLIAAMDSLEKIYASNLSVAEDLLKIQTDMENQAKSLVQGLHPDGINFPLTELTNITLPREQNCSYTPNHTRRTCSQRTDDQQGAV